MLATQVQEEPRGEKKKKTLKYSIIIRQLIIDTANQSSLFQRLMRNHVWSTKLFAVEWDLQFAPGPPPPTLRSCLDVFWLAVLHVYFVMCRSAMQAIMAVPICRE